MDDIISAQNLTKTFGNFTAVNDVSFNVPKGEIFAFLGPNGAGKTTTIKMLTTLLSLPAELSNGMNRVPIPKRPEKLSALFFRIQV